MAVWSRLTPPGIGVIETDTAEEYAPDVREQNRRPRR
jgi:hypothetical protein